MSKNPIIKVQNIPPAPEPTKPNKTRLPTKVNYILHRFSMGRNKRLFKEESVDKQNRDMTETRATK